MTNSDDQRTLGMLIEQGRYQDKRLDRIEGKLDTLLADKWKRYGASVVVSGLLSMIVAGIVAILKG